ncbi:MAG: ribosomal RNA small subunit methyltransferase A [Candidatus Omnitrophica bacterium]|nr:ribosomal RNA small subunit methyltransferase A [Candidatus Omnitrophota bacterium]
MDLVQLKQLWKENGFSPNKKLGQNFLIDKNVRDKIIKHLPLEKETTLIEVGAGFGVMSFSLAALCGRLVAVEKDDRVSRIMKPIFAAEKNIKLVQGDILDIDLAKLTDNTQKIIVYGNIPYYITTPLIAKIIDQRQIVDKFYLVLQEEVANRIIAPPGSKTYGALSCFVQFYTTPAKFFRIKKNSFYPKPKVESCLLELKILKDPSVKVQNKELMFKIIRTAFSQRRKKIINPLSARDFLGIDKHIWEGILEKCHIPPQARAENLSLKDYAKLSDSVEKSV